MRIAGEWDRTQERVSSSSCQVSARPASSAATHPEQSRTNNESSVPAKKRRTNNSRLMNVDDLEEAVKVTRNLEKHQGDIAESFGRFVAKSVRKLPAERQYRLMSKITAAMSEFFTVDEGS